MFSLLADAALAISLGCSAALPLAAIAELILHALTLSDLRLPMRALLKPCCMVGLERSLIGEEQALANAAPLRLAAQLGRQRRHLERLRGLARSHRRRFPGGPSRLPGRTSSSRVTDNGAYKCR